MRLAIVSLTICALLGVAVAQSVFHPIASLPGLTESSFNQYSGYAQVNPSGRRLFFWFAEAQNNPASSPVVLWLNGGPGCSSLLGLMTENGPFSVLDDGKTLKSNPTAWNTLANMIWLESPAGVGFSWSSDGNYTTGDDQTAKDNYQFLVEFFKMFPQYAKNDFYIAGESYAGHYVPQLALQVVYGNSIGKAHIPLRGILAGNPSFDFPTDANSYIPFMAQHALISESEFATINATCKGVFYNNQNQDCNKMVADVSNRNFGYINPYNIIGDCVGDGPSTDGGCLTHQGLSRGLRTFTEFTSLSQTFVPCVDVSPARKYFQQQSVRDALHVSPHAFEWDVCSSHINYVQYAPTMLTVYPKLINANIRVLIYSGDVDSCVPYLGTYRCVEKLGLSVIKPWQPWFIKDNKGYQQTAGYTVKYTNGVTYATIRAAGHMVPTYRPLEAVMMFGRFIAGQDL